MSDNVFHNICSMNELNLGFDWLFASMMNDIEIFNRNDWPKSLMNDHATLVYSVEAD